MSRFEDQLPEDVREVARRLTEARATFSPLDRDALRTRIGRSSRRRGPGRLRLKSVAGLLTAGLMLTSGAGVVIASSELGGGRHTFDNTGGDNGGGASRCQYHGRHEEDRDIGELRVIITFDCHRRDIHIEFPGHYHFGFDGGTNDPGNGTWNGQAPGNASSLDISAGGRTTHFSFNW